MSEDDILRVVACEEPPVSIQLVSERLLSVGEETIEVDTRAVAPEADSSSREARASTPVLVSAPRATTEVGAPRTELANEIG